MIYQTNKSNLIEKIAELVPEERHGVFSTNDELKQQADEIASFPFESDEMRGM